MSVNRYHWILFPASQRPLKEVRPLKLLIQHQRTFWQIHPTSNIQTSSHPQNKTSPKKNTTNISSSIPSYSNLPAKHNQKNLIPPKEGAAQTKDPKNVKNVEVAIKEITLSNENYSSKKSLRSPSQKTQENQNHILQKTKETAFFANQPKIFPLPEVVIGSRS